MRQTAFFLLILFSGSGVVLADDTFSSFLRKATHVGVAVNERLSSFDLHVYTKGQYDKNVASLEQYRVAMEEYRTKLEDWENERREAQSRRAPVQELNAITQKRSQIAKPSSQFVSRIQLHKVTNIGDDYFALAPLGATEETVLLPFGEVARVFVLSTPASDSEPRDEGEP